MLIVLSESLIGHLSGASPSASALKGLDMLALAFSEGKHILAGGVNTLDSLLKVQALQNQTYAALRLSRDRYPELMALPGNYSSYISVVPDNHGSIQKVIISGKMIIEVPLSHFSDSARVQKLVLLTENLDDAKIVNLMATFYKRNRGFTAIPVYFEPDCGSGSNLGAIIEQHHATGDRFCLIIVDSDKSCPEGGIGDTLKHVRKKFKATGPSPKMTLMELECKEMENALPDEFFREHYRDDLLHSRDSALLEKLSSLGEIDIRNFIDIKEGLKLSDILALDRASPEWKFWKSKLETLHKFSSISCIEYAACVDGESCQNTTQCKCIFLAANSTSILENAEIELNRWKIAQWRTLDQRTSDVWMQLGQTVFEWSSGWTFSTA